MIALLLIITIPAFQILLNNFYFSMHDDQHIVRLFLLDQGIREGSLFPRWVGGLGFGYGYPLYNFYPPLIYYIAEFFHLLGFTYIWSIKLVIILGFILAAWGSYLLIKDLLGRWPAILGATIYTYFFYHSVNVYVRGALAEFFAMAVLPFMFIFINRLFQKSNLKNAVYFGLSLAGLILTHPLIAFPAIFFIGFAFLFYLWMVKKDKINFVKYFLIGSIVGLALSSFFWLPSVIEKKYTLTDTILTTELADYKKHFVCPYQFWYSAWGYGGSGENCQSGLTFQLGKIPILLVFTSFLLSLLSRKKRHFYYFFLFMLAFSLFMATAYSAFVWKAVSFMAYLQWPWRFLTFTSLFISILCSYNIYFIEKFFSKKIIALITIALSIITVIKYQQYFRPQQLLVTNDSERTSFKEIAWRISGTSYEFVPKEVKTKKTILGTTTLAIDEKDLPKKPYEIISGKADVKVKENKFDNKVFEVNAQTPTQFRLNTYYFPGWRAYLSSSSVIPTPTLRRGRNLKIDDKNDLKLITVTIPQGLHSLSFYFTDTAPRRFGDWISLIAVFILLAAVGKAILLPRLQAYRKS